MREKNKVLVCVAHSDDETFGCGGTIAKHVSKGDKVYCISFTDGVSSRKNTKLSDIKKREVSKNKASKILGFKWVKTKTVFEDNKLSFNNLLDITKIIEISKKKIKPNIIYTHFADDLNIDHRVVAEATLTAFRPEPNEKLEQLITIEVPSATDFRILKNKKNFLPNYFLNIEKFLKYKIKAIKCYKNELKKYPHSRSVMGIKNLSKIRGHQSGLKFAEAFEIIRKIEK